MEKFFYSPTEKIAFWIAGYRQDMNVSIKYLRDSLYNDMSEFTRLFGDIDEPNPCLNKAEYKTDDIKVIINWDMKSRRYHSMRIFYIENIEECPKKAFSIETHTMHSWLEG
jgi:hypothetical protein